MDGKIVGNISEIKRMDFFHSLKIMVLLTVMDAISCGNYTFANSAKTTEHYENTASSQHQRSGNFAFQGNLDQLSRDLSFENASTEIYWKDINGNCTVDYINAIREYPSEERQPFEYWEDSNADGIWEYHDVNALQAKSASQEKERWKMVSCDVPLKQGKIFPECSVHEEKELTHQLLEIIKPCEKK